MGELPLAAASVLLASALAGGCGPTPHVKSTADFRGDALNGKRVAFVPLAVSDALEDQRTGVMLSDRTRELASAGACRRLAEGWSDGTVVCLVAGTDQHAATLAEVQRLFALDQAIPSGAWQELRRVSKADYALLFRPEGVSASQKTTQEMKGGAVFLLPGNPITLATSAAVSALVSSQTVYYVNVNDTELGYTLSASLIDLRTGKVLKVGVHSGSGSRTVKGSRGYAEAPPAAPIVEDIMASLAAEVLDD